MPAATFFLAIGLFVTIPASYAAEIFRMDPGGGGPGPDPSIITEPRVLSHPIREPEHEAARHTRAIERSEKVVNSHILQIKENPKLSPQIRDQRIQQELNRQSSCESDINACYK